MDHIHPLEKNEFIYLKNIMKPPYSYNWMAIFHKLKDFQVFFQKKKCIFFSLLSFDKASINVIIYNEFVYRLWNEVTSKSSSSSWSMVLISRPKITLDFPLSLMPKCCGLRRLKTSSQILLPGSGLDSSVMRKLQQN